MTAVAPAAEPLKLAQTIITFAEGSDDPFALLSLAPGLPQVSLATPIGDLRSNYRKLAALIHPDRLKKVFEQATEAFQKLVRVFENVNDPSYRAKLTAAAGGGGGKKAKGAKPKKEKIAPKKKEKAVSSKKKKKEHGDYEGSVSDSDSSSDDDSSDDEDDDEDDLLLGATKKKGSSASKKPAAPVTDEFGMCAREARDNTGCYRTPVACPNCSDVWQPDDARHYVMLMAYGVRVWCNTCLLQFGPAAAVHSCPCCKGPATYDISMFDKKVKCTLPKCGKTYGFSSVAVTDKHLEAVREKLRIEAYTRQRDEERAQRAAARSGGASGGSAFSAAAAAGGSAAAASSSSAKDNSAEIEDAIGQCMVMGSCPLCEKNVSMKKSREHVTQCYANPPKKKRAAGACVIVGEAGERKKAAAAAAKKKAATATAAKKSTALAAKKPAAKKPAAKKKRGRNDSDSDDSSDDDASYASSD